MEGIERKGYRKIIFLLLGTLLTVSILFNLPNRVYAAEAGSKAIQQRSPGNKEPVQGKGKVDVDGTVKAKTGDTDSSSKSSAAKSSKPSTTQVGNGLNDKLTQNAKTGDLNSNLIFLILLVVSVVLLAVVFKQRTAKSKQ